MEYIKNIHDIPIDWTNYIIFINPLHWNHYKFQKFIFKMNLLVSLNNCLLIYLILSFLTNSAIKHGHNFVKKIIYNSLWSQRLISVFHVSRHGLSTCVTAKHYVHCSSAKLYEEAFILLLKENGRM